MKKMKRHLAILKQSLREFNDDHGDHFAASISFNLFFSLFPLAVAAVYVTGSIPALENLQEHIIGGISYLLPGFGELMGGIASNVEIVRRGIGVLVIVGAIMGGISFFNAVTLSLNIAFGRRPLSLLKTQLVNFILLLAAGLLVGLSILFTIALNSSADPALHNEISQYLGSRPAMLVIANVMVTIFAFLLFLLCYMFMPSHRPPFKDVWAAALVAALFFEATKLVFILFLQMFNPYNLVDRSVATAIGFMMWAYISALVFLFVAKFTHVSLRMRAEEKEPAAK
jgi:membrane protein